MIPLTDGEVLTTKTGAKLRYLVESDRQAAYLRLTNQERIVRQAYLSDILASKPDLSEGDAQIQAHEKMVSDRTECPEKWLESMDAYISIFAPDSGKLRLHQKIRLYREIWESLSELTGLTDDDLKNSPPPR